MLDCRVEVTVGIITSMGCSKVSRSANREPTVLSLNTSHINSPVGTSKHTNTVSPSFTRWSLLSRL